MRNMYGYNEDSNLEKYGNLKDGIGSIMKSNCEDCVMCMLNHTLVLLKYSFHEVSIVCIAIG